MGKQGDEEEIFDLSAHFLFTIRFDEQGKWRVIKTHRMTEEEVKAKTSADDAAKTDEE
jgi:hypothetical protein